MNDQQARVTRPDDFPSAVVRLRDEDGGFVGSGILVASDIVLTCAHVVGAASRLDVEAASAAGGIEHGWHKRTATVLFPPPVGVSVAAALATHAGEDLAVVQLAQALDGVAPLPLAESVTPAALAAASGRLEVSGFRSPRGTMGAARALSLRGSPWTRADGTIKSGQIDGGVPSGFSGSPLLYRASSGWLAVGMMFLGGEGAGQSTFYGPDVLLALLRQLGLSPQVQPASIAIAGFSSLECVDLPASSERASARARTGGPEDSAARYPVGTVISGKYRVDRVIGAGGMGVVLAAHHVELDEPVALKLLHPSQLVRGDARTRFKREARTAAKLRGQHVVQIRDVATTADGIPYIVMEQLRGRDLGQLLSGGPLPIARAVQCMLQACKALREAHAHGIVHRDLKPANLFLCDDGGAGVIKVLDFGIAKALDGEGELVLTDTHQLVGSPSYMAPEQMRGSREIDLRTDIWTLGVVLFELLTGRRPFPAHTLSELCAQVARDPAPSVRTFRPDVPHGLARTVARCLEKNPQHRYASVDDLTRDLSVFANEPPRDRPSPRRWLIAGVAASAALAASLVWPWPAAQPKPPTTTDSAAPIAAEPTAPKPAAVREEATDRKPVPPQPSTPPPTTTSLTNSASPTPSPRPAARRARRPSRTTAVDAGMPDRSSADELPRIPDTFFPDDRH